MSGQVNGYELARVALGEAEADLAVINGNVVNVYTGEVLAGDTVLIKGERIAYVGKNAGKSIGSNTRVIDASGRFVIPGFIDGHTHVDHIYNPGELARYAMKGGTTSIISETAEIVFPLGYQGVLEFLRSVRNQPIKFWITLPVMVTISPSDEEHAVTAQQLRRLLRSREVAGLGEAYWAPVIAGNSRIQEILTEAKKAGKRAEGHAAGAMGNKLQAYASLGFSSDHEPISAEEVLERMRLGMFVLLREGEIRRELEATSQLKDREFDFRWLALASDGIGPWQLTTDGYMEFIVQKAINLGFSPVQAIQMATINVAQHFRLDDLIGGIAPGKYADIAIIPDLKTIRAEYVISNGQIVSRNGELLVLPRKHHYPRWAINSIHLDKDFTASDFVVPVASNRSQVKVRVIDQITNLVTKEAVTELAVVNGQVQMDVARDVVKIAAIERTHVPGKTFTGFVKGYGLKSGALAGSTMWDSCDIIVIGADETDMALAVNRLRQMQGGVVACQGGVVKAEVPMTIGGVASLEPMEILGQKLHNFQQAAESFGCILPDVRITISTMTSGAIPFFRICEHGLFNLRLNSFVDLIAED